jgi:hypothetical protein
MGLDRNRRDRTIVHSNRAAAFKLRKEADGDPPLDHGRVILTGPQLLSCGKLVIGDGIASDPY